jgi:hypothetical protein
LLVRAAICSVVGEMVDGEEFIDSAATVVKALEDKLAWKSKSTWSGPS